MRSSMATGRGTPTLPSSHRLTAERETPIAWARSFWVRYPRLRIDERSSSGDMDARRGSARPGEDGMVLIASFGTASGSLCHVSGEFFTHWARVKAQG